MNVRLAACDPCRRAKLACGHERPACVRCRDRGQADMCVYREQPFKRRKQDSGRQSTTRSLDASIDPGPSSRPHRYPNPGFLGSSSHSTIFSQVSGTTGPTLDTHTTVPSSSAALNSDTVHDRGVSSQSVTALGLLHRLDVPSLKALVEAWMTEGVNLPLAGPLVSSCATAACRLWEGTSASPSSPGDDTRISDQAAILHRNTYRPLHIHKDLTFTGFMAQFLEGNIRWETLTVFVTAATRAALDTRAFPALYASDDKRRALIADLTDISDRSLEICLAADRLNDMQLVLQYENFIVHSQVEGDQSYRCWRRMGDLGSSLFALGYHENIGEASAQLPEFIVELRKATFARIYTADKSLAIFLGRPPRITKSYCNFQLPSDTQSTWATTNDQPDVSRLEPRTSPFHDEANDLSTKTEVIGYMANTRCSATFAALKEEIMEIARDRSSTDHGDKFRTLQARIEQQWEALPAHFRLKSSLKECRVSSRFDRDFLVGTRLDYLHALLLLHLIRSRRAGDLNPALLLVAGEILSLVVEVIILRDRLVNSGTSLIWKISQFGLPAAGVISLALLGSPASNEILPASRSRMVQNLSIFAAEVSAGAVIQDGEPNFALFTRATLTIQNLLDSLMMWRSPTTENPSSLAPLPLDGWLPHDNFDPWEFEFGFWANLAEHPTLLNQEY